MGPGFTRQKELLRTEAGPTTITSLPEDPGGGVITLLPDARWRWPLAGLKGPKDLRTHGGTPS